MSIHHAYELSITINLGKLHSETNPCLNQYMLIKDVEPAFKDPTSANGGLTLSDIIGFDDTC